MKADGSYSPLRQRRRRSDWIIIISIALLAHLLVFIFLKPSYLEIFRTEPPGEEGTSKFRFVNEALSTEPYPEYVEEIKDMTVPVEVVDDEEVLKSLISEIGEPSLDVEPVSSGGRSGGGDGLSGPRRSTVEPKPLFMPWPKYPDGVDRDIRGKVELMLYVDEKGTVREVKLSRGLSHELLNQTAIAAASRIRFIPGEVKGVPTGMWIRLTIGFQPK